MIKSRISINPTPPFSFKNTIYSHGWAALRPNVYDKESNKFTRIELLDSRKVVKLTLTGTDDYQKPIVNIYIESETELLASEKKEIKDKVRYMLRIDEDLTPFYKLCNKKGGEWKELTKGLGRLLRGTSLFEDIVKIICTTNVQWSGTKGMADRLCEFYGEPLPSDKSLRAFPTPEKIARSNLKMFDKKVRMGYRSEYVHLLARQIIKGDLDLNKFFDKSTPTPDLKKDLLKIKGIGSYASALLLMMLERYDEIAVDTVFREFMKQKYYPELYPSDKESMKIYDEWKKWKFLAYWFDLWQFHRENV
ncbi:MAG: hypothetical protein KKA84_04975 [Bacteroidetes bacterium]|nr:hypothetical protein [Bacteroidota bacterium]